MGTTVFSPWVCLEMGKLRVVKNIDKLAGTIGTEPLVAFLDVLFLRSSGAAVLQACLLDPGGGHRPFLRVWDRVQHFVRKTYENVYFECLDGVVIKFEMKMDGSSSRALSNIGKTRRLVVIY